MVDALILALALAMDATAVAAARGVAGGRRDVIALAIAFGAFQAGMAALGLLLGRTAASAIASWDHWLAFGLLAAIGGKMIVDAVRSHGDDAAAEPERLSVATVLVLAIATSIDALAAGVTLPVLAAPAPIALALIGLASLILSLAGGLAGARIGRRGGRMLEAAGGLALIGIGVRTLIQHLR